MPSYRSALVLAVLACALGSPPPGLAGADDAGAGPPPDSSRRGLPAPLESPPLPSAEYIGIPNIGVPAEADVYPLMKWLNHGDEKKAAASRVKVYGWLNGSLSISTSKNSTSCSRGLTGSTAACTR